MEFEKLMKELEEVVLKLESGNLNLDETLKLYHKGLELQTKLQKILEEAKLIIENRTDNK